VLAEERQSWVQLQSDGGQYSLIALANPNSHTTEEGGFVITTEELLDQHWGDASRIARNVRMATLLSSDLPERRISFSSADAGNSLWQFHLNVNRMPKGIRALPIERVFREHHADAASAAIGLNGDYPAPCLCFRGNAAAVGEKMSKAISGWATAPERTGNFLVRTDVTGVTTAFFWPRLSCWRRAPGWRSGEISFLELAGFFLVSDAEDERAVASGDIDHAHLWRVLLSISDEEAFAFCGGWAAANADPA
jgi:hypothetical protein